MWRICNLPISSISIMVGKFKPLGQSRCSTHKQVMWTAHVQDATDIDPFEDSIKEVWPIHLVELNKKSRFGILVKNRWKTLRTWFGLFSCLDVEALLFSLYCLSTPLELNNIVLHRSIKKMQVGVGRKLNIWQWMKIWVTLKGLNFSCPQQLIWYKKTTPSYSC
jgi:hypothetical protein